MQFCLHRFQPCGHVECQLPAYRVARVDVVEKHAVRPVGTIEVYVRARACVVFPAAGVVDVLAGVIEGLRLTADIGDCDVQDRVLSLRGVTEAISGVAYRLGIRDRCDDELEFSVSYRSADLGDLRRDWRRVRRCRATARRWCALATPVRGNRDDDDQDDEPSQAQETVPYPMTLLLRRLLRGVILLLRRVVRLLLGRVVLWLLGRVVLWLLLGVGLLRPGLSGIAWS